VKAMPFDAEFKKHLHSLMVEVAQKTQDEWVQHKNELVGKARATHNGAAVPIAYKDAELYRMELRLSKTIEKYIEAVSIWGYSIDAVFERDMANEFQSLTAGPNQISLPPAIKGQHVQAVQQSYSRERAQLANRLVREGTNRLKELKMKNMQAKRAAGGNTTNNFNTVFNAPVGTANIGSTIYVANNVTITTQHLQEIDQISEGNPQLQTAAIELRNAHAQGVGAVEKLQKWANLAITATGVAEKIHQYYPHIAAWISSWTK
jgi:hypothetical protein